MQGKWSSFAAAVTTLDETTMSGDVHRMLIGGPSPGRPRRGRIRRERDRLLFPERPAPRLLRGRRLGDAAFEAEVQERPLDWSPPDRATLELADGRRLEVEIDAARTTRAGRIEVGRSLRVALVHPPEDLGAEILAVEIGELRIEL
jgi:hypothetical protein